MGALTPGAVPHAFGLWGFAVGEPATGGVPQALGIDGAAVGGWTFGRLLG